MPKKGKKYEQAAKLVDASKLYPLEEAVGLVKQVSFSTFDGTVEAHIRLGIDPRQADQQVRSTVTLPAGTGRSVRVLAFAQGEKVTEAEAAGADYVGGAEYAKQIQDGWLDFDAVIATPDMMGQVGRLGRILGPRGLMPSPRVPARSRSTSGRPSAKSRPGASSSAPTAPDCCTFPSARYPLVKTLS